MVEAEIGHFSVTCMFKNVEDGFLWALTGVYGPVKRCKKGIVLGRTRVVERLMGVALVHWWRLQYGSFPQ